MPTYCFRCPDCGAVLQRNFAMSDEEGRANVRCEFCEAPMVRDYGGEGKALFAKPWWNEHLTTDTIPASVKGSGRASKEFRDFADRTQAVHGGRWV